MSDDRLDLSHRPDDDWLIALEFGRIDDGQPTEIWRGVTDSLGLLRSRPGCPKVADAISEAGDWASRRRHGAARLVTGGIGRGGRRRPSVLM